MAFYSNKKNPKQAAEEIIEKVNSTLDFDPDLVLFYATLKYNGQYQKMLDIFKNRFGDVPQIGASVDGMIFPHDVRTDGAILVVGEDNEARIEVKSINEKSATKSAEKLARQIKCEKGVVILHFPLIHVPDLKKSTEFYTKGKYYSLRANRSDEKNKKKIAAKFSDFCDKSNIFYLPPTLLDIFSKQLNNKIPIVGINVLHTQLKFNSPSIFGNFKDIGDGISALVIEKENIEVIYDDIYPGKGRTLKETKEILKENITIKKEFKALFEKNILISLDNYPPVKAVKEVTGAYEKDELELKENLNKGTLQVGVPYFLLFLNEQTKGFVNVGIDAYFPFDLFPLFVDINNFSNVVYLAHEPIYGRHLDFISGLYMLKNVDNFNFFCIDVGTISEFGNKIIEYNEDIKEILNDNYFGIFSGSPSIFLPIQFKNREYITELQDNIYCAGGGNNLFTSI